MHIALRLPTLVFVLTGAFFAGSPAQAHTDHFSDFGFLSGFAHPFSGFDHILAMATIGLWAAQRGGTALLVAPTACLLAGLVGAAAAAAGATLPGAEHMMALSVVAVALPVTLAAGIPMALASPYMALFAFFHGFGHGLEQPAGADTAAYFAGFLVATLLIQAGGLAVGLTLKVTEKSSLLARLIAGAAAAAGVAFFTA